MSTDDDLDARLQQAGARWRDANTAIATVDLAAATVAGPVTDVPTEVPLVHPVPRRPQRRKRIWVTAIVGVAAMAAAAVVAVQLGGHSAPKPSPVAGRAVPLVGTDWLLTYATFDGGRRLRATEGESLRIESRQLVVYDGINTYSGAVTITANRLKIGDLAGSLVGTTPGYVGDGIDLTKVTSGDVGWSVSGDMLTITKDGVGSLTYRAKANPVTATDPSAVIGVNWLLTTVESGGAGGTSSTPAAQSVLSITSGGSFTADHRCYWRRGTAHLAKGTADFTDTHTDPHSCPAPTGTAQSAAATDALIDTVLTGTTRWSITADRLTVTRIGVGSLIYTRGTALAASDVPSATATK